VIGVDTNVFLNVLRIDDPPAQRKGSLDFFKFTQQMKIDIAISVITLTELFRKPFSHKSSEEKQKIDAFLHLLNVRPVTISSDAAIEAARLIEECSTHFADALIAASLDFSKVHIFVTRNKLDYKKTNLQVLTPEEFIQNVKLGAIII